MWEMTGRRRGEDHRKGGRSTWTLASDLMYWSSTSAEGGKSHWGFTVGNLQTELRALGSFLLWDSVLVEYSLRDCGPEYLLEAVLLNGNYPGVVREQKGCLCDLCVCVCSCS